jgi:lysophospholipid acyltransferase (LPLAT)-like uncharacterized protein
MGEAVLPHPKARRRPLVDVRRGLKLFFRLAGVQATIAWLLAFYLRATFATMRWRYENREAVDAAAVSPEGAIACFWHGRIALAPALRHVFRDKPRRVIISTSPDGEFIAKTVARLGFPAIRGTSALTDKRRTVAGAFTFREAMKFVQGGGVLIVTPDGPRGPAQRMPIGPVVMARLRGTSVYFCGLAASPAVTLHSWDRGLMPLPFSRGCAVFVGPLTVPRDADADALEAVRLDWEAQMNAAQARAAELLAAG